MYLILSNSSQLEKIRRFCRAVCVFAPLVPDYLSTRFAAQNPPTFFSSRSSFSSDNSGENPKSPSLLFLSFRKRKKSIDTQLDSSPVQVVPHRHAQEQGKGKSAKYSSTPPGWNVSPRHRPPVDARPHFDAYWPSQRRVGAMISFSTVDAQIIIGNNSNSFFKIIGR